jgi:methionine sulfoxide reductase heme-binding subunit
MEPSVLPSDLRGQVAQSVEQEPEKLRVGGSIPSLPIPLAGWWLVAWTAAIVGAMTGAILVSRGITSEGLHVVLRATARTSLALFLAVFVASPLRAIWPHRFADWLVDNRRYLGVSFATSHGFHFSAIITLTRVSAEPPQLVTVVLGSLGYLFILAMAATSFDATAAWLGARRWKRLHATGLYYLWVVFTLTSLGGAADGDPLAALSLALLSTAMALRFGRRIALRARPVAAH